MLSYGVRKLSCILVVKWYQAPPTCPTDPFSQRFCPVALIVKGENGVLWLCVSVAAAVKSPGKLDSSFMDGEEGNFSLQHLSHLNPRLCNYSENGIG